MSIEFLHFLSWWKWLGGGVCDWECVTEAKTKREWKWEMAERASTPCWLHSITFFNYTARTQVAACPELEPQIHLHFPLLTFHRFSSGVTQVSELEIHWLYRKAWNSDVGPEERETPLLSCFFKNKTEKTLKKNRFMSKRGWKWRKGWGDWTGEGRLENR